VQRGITVISTFYQRLRARGKPTKVARCAAVRKLLHIAWVVATKGQPFDPHYHERVVPTGWHGAAGDNQRHAADSAAPPMSRALRDGHALGAAPCLVHLAERRSSRARQR
jgi:hypothetical protein